MSEEAVLSWGYFVEKLKIPFVWFWDFYTFLWGVVLEVMSWHILFVCRAANLVLRVQWNPTLNLLGNIGYNLYLPDSKGHPSMHATMLAFAAAIGGITMWSEILRFVSVPSYQFSVGFYTSLTALLGIVQLAFSHRENAKLKSETSSEHAPAPEESEPEPTQESEPITEAPEEDAGKKKSLRKHQE